MKRSKRLLIPPVLAVQLRWLRPLPLSRVREAKLPLEAADSGRGARRTRSQIRPAPVPPRTPCSRPPSRVVRAKARSRSPALRLHCGRTAA